jgi:hypothetical protein
MLHFQPKFSSTLLLMSNNGTVLVTDVNDNGKNSQSYQVMVICIACGAAPWAHKT